jgi:hypothetical protein
MWNCISHVTGKAYMEELENGVLRRRSILAV